MDDIAFPQRGQRSLHHTDVTFHTAQQNRVAMAGQAFEHGTENVAAEAGEDLLIDRIRAWDERSDFGDGVAEALRVLHGGDMGNFEDTGEADEELGILDQPLSFEDRWEELLLDINNDEGAAFGIEGLARYFSGIAAKLGVAEGRDHRVCLLGKS